MEREKLKMGTDERTIAEWGRDPEVLARGLTASSIRSRIRLGWLPEDAILLPKGSARPEGHTTSSAPAPAAESTPKPRAPRRRRATTSDAPPEPEVLDVLERAEASLLADLEAVRRARAVIERLRAGGSLREAIEAAG